MLAAHQIERHQQGHIWYGYFGLASCVDQLNTHGDMTKNVNLDRKFHMVASFTV